MRRINNPNIYKLRSMFMFMITILVIFTSIGYSALSSSLMISGEAYVRVAANVRITNVTWLESNNQGYETYNSEYYKEGIKVFATLPNIDSSITYKIEITNNTDIIYIIDGINELINSNELMTYTIENIDSDILNKQVTTFNITIKYKDTVTEVPSNNIGVFELKLNLRTKDNTPPVLTVNESNESGYNNFEDGAVIYYDVLTGKPCNNYHEDNSKTNYNGTTDTKTTDNQNSCLKFYAFNYDEGDSKVNLLLDHNTTEQGAWYGGGSNSTGPDTTFLNQLKTDTSSWIGTITPTNYTVSQTWGGNYTIDYSDYKARLITANEIAEITGNTNFDESTSSNWFYFDSNTQTTKDTCKSGDTSDCSYGWLYDRTYTSCTEYGCSNNSDVSGFSGYWTSTSAFGSGGYAWSVHYNGSLTYGLLDCCAVDDYYCDYGIRPVIEVLKSNLEKQIVINAYDNESGLSDENNYQYYLSTSSTTLENGVWTNYTIGKPITINQDKTLYLWLYPIKDNAGNVNDNKVINTPYVAFKREKIYKDGDIVYYDVLNGTTCTNYHEDNSKTGYNGVTTTTSNQNSCLKFYAFNDDEGDTTVNLLLDHNTTVQIDWNSSGNNSTGPEEPFLTQLKIDTDSWIGTITPTNYTVSQTSGGNYTIDYSDYKARLITANEIAEITGNTSFDESTTSHDNSFYFDINTTTESSTCKSGNTTGCSYGWLYDRTAKNCTEYGCLNNSDVEAYGYWTSTSVAGSSYVAWSVYYYGILFHGYVSHYSYGIRPVIEVLKSNL